MNKQNQDVGGIKIKINLLICGIVWQDIKSRYEHVQKAKTKNR